MCIECGCGSRSQWTCPCCGGRIILVNNEPVCTLCGATFAQLPDPSQENEPTHHHLEESAMTSEDLARLRLLLPHWIEHNQEHAEEFAQWAERAQAAGEPHVAEHLRAAARMLAQANEALEGALDHMGGAPGHEHPGHAHAHG